jgi:hypothetical protein
MKINFALYTLDKVEVAIMQYSCSPLVYWFDFPW